MFKLKSAGLMILLLLLSSGGVWANEYFLYDLEKNKILVMGNEETAFTERMDLEKNPDMLMRTKHPDRFLAVYAPRFQQDKQGRIIKYYQPGNLTIINLSTGRTEDLVELGYLPFMHAYTKDHRDFFMIYQGQPNGMPELLYYNTSALKSKKLTSFAKQIRLLEVSEDQKNLYIVTSPERDKYQLLTVNIASLEIKNSLTLDNHPDNLFVLGNDRIALIDTHPKGSNSRTNGSVKLIDTQNNSIIEERKFTFVKGQFQWYSDVKTLIIITADKKMSRCYKLTREGFRYYQIPDEWIDYSYLAAKDLLYILTTDSLKVIDYKNSATRMVNTEGPNDDPENYHFYHLPNSNWAIIYCVKTGDVKFFDIQNNKIVKKVNCGRTGIKILKTLLMSMDDTGTVVTINQSATRFYILNRATNDITVFDESFKRITYIVPREPLLAMYQVRQPNLETIVITEKGVYRINEQDATLAPIYQFISLSQPAFFQEEAKRIILMTNQELLVIDPVSFTIKNKFDLFIGANEKYTRLKPGDQRYYFIRPL